MSDLKSNAITGAEDVNVISVQAEVSTVNQTSNLKYDSEGRVIISSLNVNQDEHDYSHLRHTADGKVIISSIDKTCNKIENATELSVGSSADFENFSEEGAAQIINDKEKVVKGKKHKKHGKKKRAQKKKTHTKCKAVSLKKVKSKDMRNLYNLKDEFLASTEVNISSIAAELLAVNEEVCVFDEDVYFYQKALGFWKRYNEQETKLELIKLFKKDERLRIRESDIQKAYRSLLINPKLQRNLLPQINTSLVNCENGVLDLKDMSFLKNSPKFGFTSCINANFDLDAKGKTAKKFFDEIVGGDDETKKLLQELIGYSLSNYIYLKKASIFLGEPNSGKSVVLNFIGQLVGEENICHVDLQKLSNPCYAARLNNCKLNIAPDLPQTSITDIGTFKSLVSSLDSIETKELYKNPKSQPCYCKMLFGANEFVPLNKLDANNAEAFFERLIIIPFAKAKPADERDPNLIEKLWEERDYIFTWAMKGLKRLIDNDFMFTHSGASKKTLNRYKARYCPEKVFFDKYLSLSEDGIISHNEVQKKYEDFADKHGISVGSYAMKNFIMRNYSSVKQKRKRINGSTNPIAVYEGLSFKE